MERRDRVKIKLYQIDFQKDTAKTGYLGYDRVMRLRGQIDPSIYRTVFSGRTECGNLEDLFVLFNTADRPAAHFGHGMSIGDVVEVVEGGGPDAAPGVYFCDTVGYRLLEDFDTSLCAPLNGHRMLVVEPHKVPYEAEVPEDYKQLQRAVGGTFECIYPFDDNCFLFCNEEGKLNGLEGNRRIGNDIIAGVFLIAADGRDGQTADMTDSQVRRYTAMFREDEIYTEEEVQDAIEYGIIAFE